ncbi:MAG: 50S ribosomal protein L6 [candidate division WOR-3 bacterium]|nr:MAG: 50S ribosomal protein L6 [candidate division WOR-3 bacterium]
MAKKRFRPITIPKGVTVTLKDRLLKVQGPKGTLDLQISTKVNVKIENDTVIVTNRENSIQSASHQGTTRSLIQNLITGVVKGYEKVLIIQGTGYRAQMSGTGLQLFLGYAKPKMITLPKAVKCELKVVKSADKGDLTYITLSGIDKQLVGDVAATIKKTRVPDPYKHKGIRYADEVIRKKVGKRAVVQA